MPMGKNRFSIHDARSLTKTKLCQCMGIINTLSKLQIFIFIIRIGNLLIKFIWSTETFALGFQMTFKRCVLKVTFHVNGLDLT